MPPKTMVRRSCFGGRLDREEPPPPCDDPPPDDGVEVEEAPVVGSDDQRGVAIVAFEQVPEFRVQSSY